MTTAEILNQMEKEFDEKFVEDLRGTGFQREAHIVEHTEACNVKDFIKGYTRTLLESFGEEVCPEWIDNPYGEVTNYSVGRRDERKAIRLKVKEIISQISK